MTVCYFCSLGKQSELYEVMCMIAFSLMAKEYGYSVILKWCGRLFFSLPLAVLISVSFPHASLAVSSLPSPTPTSNRQNTDRRENEQEWSKKMFVLNLCPGHVICRAEVNSVSTVRRDKPSKCNATAGALESLSWTCVTVTESVTPWRLIWTSAEQDIIDIEVYMRIWKKNKARHHLEWLVIGVREVKDRRRFKIYKT